MRIIRLRQCQPHFVQALTVPTELGPRQWIDEIACRASQICCTAVGLAPALCAADGHCGPHAAGQPPRRSSRLGFTPTAPKMLRASAHPLLTVQHGCASILSNPSLRAVSPFLSESRRRCYATAPPSEPVNASRTPRSRRGMMYGAGPLWISLKKQAAALWTLTL